MFVSHNNTTSMENAENLWTPANKSLNHLLLLLAEVGIFAGISLSWSVPLGGTFQPWARFQHPQSVSWRPFHEVLRNPISYANSYLIASAFVWVCVCVCAIFLFTESYQSGCIRTCIIESMWKLLWTCSATVSSLQAPTLTFISNSQQHQAVG